MAIREIRVQGDEVLTKVCKEVKSMTPRTAILIEDMIDTMYEAQGVGLAAPQVGILKRIVVIDVGEGPIILINPEILEVSGEQTGDEGCLSVPGRYGEVPRPEKVVVSYVDRNGDGYELIGEGLLATCICHELDHLDGVLFAIRNATKNDYINITLSLNEAGPAPMIWNDREILAHLTSVSPNVVKLIDKFNLKLI